MEADELFKILRNDPHGRFSDIEKDATAIFSKISTEDLTAMEHCTHRASPYGGVIANVLTERILIGIKHD